MFTKAASFTFRLSSVWTLLNLLLVAMSVTPTSADSTIVVNSLADTVAADGKCTLREAIQNASSRAATNPDCAAGSGGDTITFSVSGTITLGSRLPDLYDEGGLTIDGTGQAVTINGNHTMQVATGGSLLTLNNLTIVNGNNSGTGGAISSSGTLIISNCTFSGNSALRGGAIDKLVGTLTITNSTFSNNTATYGGAIYNDGGTVTITGSTFSGNSAPSNDGGAIYSSAGPLTITNSTFSGNSAYLGLGGAIYKVFYALTITDTIFLNNSANGGKGGAIYSEAGPLIFTNSSFSGNSATDGLGGAVYNAYGYPNDLTVRGSTFSSNSAGSGGGVYNNGYPSTITNSTFSGNTASGNGGGVLNNYGSLIITNDTFSANNGAGSSGSIGNAASTAITLRNTILKNNTGGNCSGAVTNGGNNIDNGVTCGWGSTNGSMSNTDPLLGTLTGSPAYFPLSPGSPAIDKGEDSICTVWPVDNESQNGVTRPQGSHCDIGSYEFNLNPPMITGNVGVAGVTLSYIDETPKTTSSHFDGSYSLTVSTNWSGTVTPTHPCFTFTPASQSYSNVTTNQTAQNYASSILGGSGCADVNILIGGTQKGRFGIPSQGSTRQSFPVNNGPVKIMSSNGLPLIAAERVIYKVNGVNTSFTEMMGLPSSQLANTYWLPWYNNVDLDTQLRIGNVSGTTANVHIFIGTTEVTPPAGLSLGSGDSTRLNYPGVNNGPVKIQSDQNIVAAERLIYKFSGTPTSFAEMMALPNGQLTTTYWLPWYNNADLDTQLRIGNVSGSTATIHIFIGGAEVTPIAGISLGAGASIRLNYPGVNNGPVKIQSDQNIVAAERVVYKVSGAPTSFTEMMALPNGQLNTTYWLPWYNNVDLDTQLRIGNVSGNPAIVHIFIGGMEVSPVAGLNLASGASTRFSYPSVNNGPVKIISDQNVVAAERVIYKVNSVSTSFSEMMGLPNSQLDTTYWLPWYNNVDLDTQLRFGMP